MNTLPVGDVLDLFVHFLMLSLLSIGGAMSTAPEMQRYFVVERGWIGEADFSTAIALAQAAPGPNVLFVPVLGFQAAGLPGAAAALVGILLPSTLLSLGVSRWGARRRDTALVRAFNDRASGRGLAAASAHLDGDALVAGADCVASLLHKGKLVLS